MRSDGLNRTQRIVIVIGLGLGLYACGGWITTRGSGSGWVAYAPLSNTPGPSDAVGGVHPWVRLLIWLALIVIWVLASVWLLRPSSDSGDSAPTV
jgi:hypothetical protein